jgi:pheophorbide a oxygenase
MTPRPQRPHGCSAHTTAGNLTRRGIVRACVPQLAAPRAAASGSTGRGGNAVRAYPVQERVGLLWVWTGDPPAASAISSASSLAALPISDLLQRHVDFYGNDAGFMRDLPYGMELLGENLLDLSHLPFSHHSVGGLKRELGMELQLKRVTVPPQSTAAPDQLSAGTQPQQQQQPRPLYQVEVVNAGRQDPIFAGLPDPAGTRDQWTTFISYYSPCHVRYERRRGSTGPTASNVELFMCPLTAGKSRVFVFNAFELALPPPASTTTINNESLFQILWRSSPKTWKSKCKKLLLQKALRPSRVAGHMLNHRIFDGDGIFLHKQGNRMDTNRLTYRDYSTPSSADLLLNAYRRYLDQAAARSSDPVAAASVHAAEGGGGASTVVYDDTAPRSVLLDRYFSHTVHCPTCREALRRTQRTKQRLATL